MRASLTRSTRSARVEPPQRHPSTVGATPHLAGDAMRERKCYLSGTCIRRAAYIRVKHAPSTSVELGRKRQVDHHSGARRVKLLEQTARQPDRVGPAFKALRCVPYGMAPVTRAYTAPDAPALALIELVGERDNEAVDSNWAACACPPCLVPLMTQGIGAASRLWKPIVAGGVDATSVAVYSSF